MKRAFRVAYDGRPYHGFQRQPDVPTVEDALFDALDGLGIEPGGYAAAGRTDAGVSAAVQTVAFECPEWCTPRALNAELPEPVWAWAAVDVPGGFHATHDARRRAYVYHCYGPDLDPGRAREATERLSGEHDFRDLTPDDRGTVRDLAASVDRDGDFLVLRASAGGFPRHLVRRLAALVRAVASGAAPISKVERVLGPERLEGPEAVSTAPAHPLVLTEVEYGVDFEVDERAAADARAAFEERRVEFATRARVASGVRDAI